MTNREAALKEVNIEIKECVELMHTNHSYSSPFHRKTLVNLFKEKEMLETGAFVYFVRCYWLPVCIFAIVIVIALGLKL